ncbi:MAG: hypothetical protein ACFFD1_07870 [Candidatus Thorarchaeota archaeon]
MVLHSPLVHFPIGAFFLTTLATILAFTINILYSKGFIPQKIKKLLGNDIVSKLDFVAHLAGIVGILSIFPVVLTGLADASGIVNPNLLDINVYLTGLSNGLSSQLLTFKIGMTIYMFNVFLFAGFLHIYFVTYKGNKNMYQNPLAIQIIYVESTIIGFFTIIYIGAVGGIIATGGTILSQVPLMNLLLPGHNPIILVLYFIIPALFALIILFLGYRDTKQNNKHKKALFIRN